MEPTGPLRTVGDVLVFLMTGGKKELDCLRTMDEDGRREWPTNTEFKAIGILLAQIVELTGDDREKVLRAFLDIVVVPEDEEVYKVLAGAFRKLGASGMFFEHIRGMERERGHKRVLAALKKAGVEIPEDLQPAKKKPAKKSGKGKK